MPFDVELFRSYQQRLEGPPALGAPIAFRSVTGSTNDDALSAARAGAPHGALFVADEQTAGRGRRGHAWLAAPGENLLFSVLLRPALDLAELSPLTLMVGIALRDVLTPLVTGRVQIKWPNDVLVGKKKLAGVLVESQLQGEHLQAVVVGIGLNVATRKFPEAIAARATSLALLGAEVKREALLCGVLQALGMRLDGYRRAGVRGLLSELEAADALRGKRIRVEGQSGIASGFDEQGRLLIESRGELCAVSSGTVELL